MNEYKKYGLSFVEIETLDKDAAFLVSKELIQELFCNMAKLCTKYSNSLFYDLPYSYTERRLDSVLLPTLSKICDSMVTTEAPTYRHFHSSNKFVGSELEIIDLNSNSKCVRERFIFDNLKKKVEVEKNENSLQTKNNSSNQTKSNENLFFNKLNKNNLFKFFMK